MYVDDLVTGVTILKRSKKSNKTQYNYSKKVVSIYIRGTQTCLNRRVKVVTKVN